MRLERFERPTDGFEIRCSIQLSYRRQHLLPRYNSTSKQGQQGRILASQEPHSRTEHATAKLVHELIIKSGERQAGDLFFSNASTRFPYSFALSTCESS